MDKLSRKVQQLEVTLHNYIVNQNNLNKKQDGYNQEIARNMIALGQKVFPEKFKEAMNKLGPANVKEFKPNSVEEVAVSQ